MLFNEKNLYFQTKKRHHKLLYGGAFIYKTVFISGFFLVFYSGLIVNT